MKIKEVGDLHQNPHIPDWLDSDETAIPFLGNQRLTITFEDIVTDRAPEEFGQAIRNFLRLSEQDREGTNRYIFADYLDFAGCVGEDDLDFKIEHARSVWDYVRPTEIYVSRRPYGDKAVYVHIAAECDWEPEHGIQLVYRQGNTLKRVSSQDGHLTNSDAYARPELEDVIFKRRYEGVR